MPLSFNCLLVISFGLRGKTCDLIFWAGFIAGIKAGTDCYPGAEKSCDCLFHIVVLSPLLHYLHFFPIYHYSH